jgi:hypothetical protein
VPDVVSNEEPRSGADRCGENRDVFRVGEFPRSLAVMGRRAVDLDRDSAEEFLEERRGLRELGGEVPTDFRHRGLGKHQTKEA